MFVCARHTVAFAPTSDATLLVELVVSIENGALADRAVQLDCLATRVNFTSTKALSNPKTPTPTPAPTSVGATTLGATTASGTRASSVGATAGFAALGAVAALSLLVALAIVVGRRVRRQRAARNDAATSDKSDKNSIVMTPVDDAKTPTTTKYSAIPAPGAMSQFFRSFFFAVEFILAQIDSFDRDQMLAARFNDPNATVEYNSQEVKKDQRTQTASSLK